MAGYLETDTEIFFYGHTNNMYACFSNFYQCNFQEINEINTTIFNCSEQYFMYYKCLLFNPDNKELLNNIINETSPYKIKKYGRQVQNYDDNVWSQNRFNIMKNALLLKFTQNKDLKIKLLNTGDKIIYEASKFDKIWGIGYFCSQITEKSREKFGLNLLGICLMQIRDELK